MDKQKIYLEPREDFDKCILKEDPSYATYSVHEIIVMLAEDWKKSNLTDSLEPDEASYLDQALEYFDYNIQPLENYYAIHFSYESLYDDSDEV